ncbi:hypothetical protein DFH28DRAFT_1138676 [Melampsora americana]|nr:hypothetical protein DFH28DRAFT_1138676 [Melampsora americana]
MTKAFNAKREKMREKRQIAHACAACIRACESSGEPAWVEQSAVEMKGRVFEEDGEEDGEFSGRRKGNALRAKEVVSENGWWSRWEQTAHLHAPKMWLNECKVEVAKGLVAEVRNQDSMPAWYQAYWFNWQPTVFE